VRNRYRKEKPGKRKKSLLLGGGLTRGQGKRPPGVRGSDGKERGQVQSDSYNSNKRLAVI